MSKKDVKEELFRGENYIEDKRHELDCALSNPKKADIVKEIMAEDPNILTPKMVRYFYLYLSEANENISPFSKTCLADENKILSSKKLLEKLIIKYLDQITDRNVITTVMEYSDHEFIDSCLEKEYKFCSKDLRNIIFNVFSSKNLDKLNATRLVKIILAQGVSLELITKEYLVNLEQKKLKKILLYIKIATHISDLVLGPANNKKLKSAIKTLEKFLKHESVKEFIIKCFNSHLNNLLKENSIEALNKFKSKLINNDLLVESENKDSLIEILFKNSVLKTMYKDIKSFVIDDRSLQYNEKNLEKKANDTITLFNSTTDAVEINNFADLKNLVTDNKSSTEDVKASGVALISDVENQ